MVILPKSDAEKTKYSLAGPTGCTGYAHWLHWRHAPINHENISVMDAKIFLNVTKHNLSFFWGLSPSRIGYYHFLIESAHWLHWLHSLVTLVAFTGRTGCIHWSHWLHPLVALVAPRTQKSWKYWRCGDQNFLESHQTQSKLFLSQTKCIRCLQNWLLNELTNVFLPCHAYVLTL